MYKELLLLVFFQLLFTFCYTTSIHRRAIVDDDDDGGGLWFPDEIINAVASTTDDPNIIEKSIIHVGSNCGPGQDLVNGKCRRKFGKQG